MKMHRILLPLLLFGLIIGRGETFPGAARVAGPPYILYFPLINREVTFTPQRIGPDYGRVLSVGQDAANPALQYAATFGSGVYKSTDAGTSWQPASAGMTYLTLQSLAVDPVTPNTLYAGTYGDAAVPYSGVFKSTDAGASWRPTGELANVWHGVRYNNPVVYALAVDRLDPNRVFAGTRMKYLPAGSLGGGGVFRSDNGGATWAPVNAGLPDEDLYIYDLALDPAHPGRVYAALHQHGLYRSDNYGDSWYALPGTPYAGRAVAVDPLAADTIYFGAVKKLGIHRSADAGGSWSQIGGGGWDIMTGALSADPLHAGLLYAGILVDNTTNYLVRSTDQGSTWQSVAGLDTWGKMLFSPDGRENLIGVDFDGTYKSLDGGVNWARSARGLTGFSVTGLAVSPAASTPIYAALYGFGVFVSIDQGASWWRCDAGLDTPNLLALTIDPGNPAALYAATDQSGVYRSTDGGQTWGALSGGYPAAAVSAGALAAREGPFSPFTNRPLPEREGFKDDPDAPALPSLTAVTGLAAGKTVAVSPGNSGVVLVGTAGRGIYRLSGSTWAPSSLSAGTVYNILFDRANPGRALAGAGAELGGVLVSSDNGQTWQASNSGLAGRAVYSLAQNPNNPAFFLAGSDSGVYRSADGGKTWSSFGLPGQAVNAVGLLPAFGGVLFAGTDTAAYYEPSGRGAWVPLDKSLNNIGIQGIQPDPSGQAVYFYTRLGGTVRVDVR